MSALNACETPILDDSPNVVDILPVDMNVVAALSLVEREGLKEKYLTIAEPQEEPK